MNKKTKVLVVTNSFPNRHNKEAAVFILNQLECLKDYCEFKVVFPYPYIPRIGYFNPFQKFSDMPFKEKINGIEVYHPKYLQITRFFLNNKFLLSIAILLQSYAIYVASVSVIKKIQKEWNFDIVHIHDPLSSGLLGAYARENYNTPLVITFHGEDVTKIWKMKVLRAIYRHALRSCDAFVFVSYYLRRVLDVKLPHEKTFIIPSGYMVGRFKPLSKNKCIEMLNLQKNRKIVLFVGWLVERKGVEYLIRAIGIAAKKDGNVICWIVGDGPLMKNLEELANKLGLNGTINFAGRKSPDEIPLWMNAADLLVLPSLNEGLPNVVVEALACGKPVVATKVAGTPEIVDKDVGYLVKPRDPVDLAKKIILALNKKWKKEKLLKRARQFSVINSTNRLLNVYKNLLG